MPNPYSTNTNEASLIPVIDDIVLTQSFAHIDTLVNTHKNNCIVKPL
jgi:hypothetical protein